MRCALGCRCRKYICSVCVRARVYCDAVRCALWKVNKLKRKMCLNNDNCTVIFIARICSVVFLYKPTSILSFYRNGNQFQLVQRSLCMFAVEDHLEDVHLFYYLFASNKHACNNTHSCYFRLILLLLFFSFGFLWLFIATIVTAFILWHMPRVPLVFLQKDLLKDL